MTLHLRTRTGMRIETARQVFAEVEGTVREVIPADEIDQILQNLGLPSNNYTSRSRTARSSPTMTGRCSSA